MGVWSQRAGEVFLEWLAPPAGLRWLDVGCGNGAFTELVAAHCAPASMHGIDPSLPQIEFARDQPALRAADFRAGDAMALPYAAASFDVAVMPLVIFFVPDAQKGVDEMARVVARGGCVAAYAWDMHGGGFPYFALQTEMRALGLAVPTPPSPESSRLEAMREHWSRAGLVQIELRTITVERCYAGFDEYWDIVQGGPSVAGQLRSLSADTQAHLKSRMRQVLPVDAAGRVTCSARAHAVKGRVRD